MRKTVAVLFGGNSCENEISILTGVFVLNLLDKEKYQPFPIYIHTDGGAYTSPKMTGLDVFREKRYSCFERIIIDGGSVYAINAAKGRLKRLAKIDVALNCCHGGLGEGGGVSALMEWNGIPLASPDLTPSGVFLDKGLTKILMRSFNVPTVEYIRIREGDYARRAAFLLRTVEGRLKYPVVVKPAKLGSSIGISVANDEEEMKRALDTAFKLDDCAVVEKFLADKKDVNCAAYSLNGEIFVSEPECAFGAGIYSFEEKYVKRKTDDTPALFEKGGGRCALSGELREKIRAYTRTVYKRMNMQGIVRMDFLVSENKAYLCEVNTVPGSLAYYLFCERLTDAKNLFSALIDDAMARGAAKKPPVQTGILRTVRWQRK